MQLKHVVCLRCPTANMYHRNRFGSGDFDTDARERSGRPKTIVDIPLQTLLDEDYTQTQDQLAEVLKMTRQGIKFERKENYCRTTDTDGQLKSHLRNFLFAA